MTEVVLIVELEVVCRGVVDEVLLDILGVLGEVEVDVLVVVES